MEATLRLHDEQGITGTSIRDVAARAGVSPATVLHHFPRMSELVRACGELSDDLFPMPSEVLLAGTEAIGERVRLVALALFGWWDASASGWEHLQIDRRSLPEVDAWLRDADERHRRLVATALMAEMDDPRVAIGTALTSFGAWRSFRAGGLDDAAAARQVATLLAGLSPAPAPTSSSVTRTQKGPTH